MREGRLRVAGHLAEKFYSTKPHHMGGFFLIVDINELSLTNPVLAN